MGGLASSQETMRSIENPRRRFPLLPPRLKICPPTAQLERECRCMELRLPGCCSTSSSQGSRFHWQRTKLYSHTHVSFMDPVATYAHTPPEAVQNRGFYYHPLPITLNSHSKRFIRSRFIYVPFFIYGGKSVQNRWVRVDLDTSCSKGRIEYEGRWSGRDGRELEGNTHRNNGV